MKTFLYVFLLFVSFVAFAETQQKQCTEGISRDALVPLVSYANTHAGAFHDHFTTTWTPATHPQALRGYVELDVLGLLPNASDSTEDGKNHHCECLHEIVQLFDEQPGLGGDSTKPGLFGRLDHKLVKMGAESNQLFENYMRTGERLFCVPEYGACGASVPLYQWYAVSEIG